MSTEGTQQHAARPDSSAVRVAIWRATHVQADPPPHVFEDTVGFALAAPEPGWERRPDLNPTFTRLFRASIVARARFIEDLVTDAAARGVDQYVLLGAGLDSFAQRRPEIAARMRVFEIDPPDHQTWKRLRLEQLGFGVPAWLQFVPVDFEAADRWRDRLVAAGFDPNRPSVVTATGVSMYLTRDAVGKMLRDVAGFAAGTTFAMTFLLPLAMADPEIRPALEMAERGARASGTPFISFFMPADMLALARASGFREARHISADDLAERYFAGRSDGLRPPQNAEELLVAQSQGSAPPSEYR